MIDGAQKPLRLVDLEKSAGEIELPNGRTVAVRPIDGTGVGLWLSIMDKTAKDADIWRLARRLLPDATEEEIGSLSITMVTIIVQISYGFLDSVLAYAASLEGKATAPMPTAPSSSPETGSATSS
jgi:hypothetical protein